MVNGIVTIQEVKDAINFPTTGGPVSDSAWSRFILEATEEVEQLYKTRLGYIDDYGIADGDYSTTEFSDSTKDWTDDDYIGYVVWIYGGTGAGQYREIVANTDTLITVSPAFDTTPDATSQYRITHLGYKDQILDGNDEDFFFVPYQPLVVLNSLEIDSVSVTPSYVYQYKEAGKLVLSQDSEVRYFANNMPQLVELKYVYGLYPVPRQLKRLVTILAAMRGVASKVSGSYVDFATIALPGGVSGSRGQPYVNLQAGISELKKEVQEIHDSYRPYVMFG